MRHACFVRRLWLEKRGGLDAIGTVSLLLCLLRMLCWGVLLMHKHPILQGFEACGCTEDSVKKHGALSELAPLAESPSSLPFSLTV